LGEEVSREQIFAAPTQSEANRQAHEWWVQQKGLRLIKQTEWAVGADLSLAQAEQWAVSIHFDDDTTDRADGPSETMPEDVRQAFGDAVRLFDRWGFDTPAPTLSVRDLNISLSGVCDLVLGYKNEPLPLNVQHELLALIDDLHLSLKAELTIDPSYAIGAQCLDRLIQHRRAAVVVARSILKKAD
jgi:hypothetical protein